MNLDVSKIEGLIPVEYGQDAVEIPGARDLLRTLEDAGARWGVVTSGSRALINGWLDVLRFAHPKVLVVAEDVELGKPDPRCYLLGRARLGLGDGNASILVLEDAPSGIKAGKAAGFQVVGLETTHNVQQVKAAGADWIVKDLTSITLKSVNDNGGVEIEIKNALQ
jgi:glycerol-1-phosphatase